jgi:GR25 family glycosyltransferase involved in LPS biosynthesis
MKTFILNLPHRYERLHRSRQELEVFHPQVWSAKVETSGQLGLMCSIKDLMKRCLDAKWFPVLICEDDVHLLYGSMWVKEFVSKALPLMPDGWQQLYLGANIEEPGSMKKINDWLYRVKSAKALHACIYSEAGLRACLEVSDLPYDEAIAKQLHKKGHAYIANPMLASQHPGYSDIRNKEVNYNFLQQRFNDAKP